jgi:HD superfamily phosphohydrolase
LGRGGDLIPSDYFDRLKYHYDRNPALADFWEVEGERLMNVTAEVCRHIDFNYRLLEPIGVGGSGVVSIAQDKRLGVPRALKIARPSPGKERLLTRLLYGEASHLVRLSHPNLIQVFAKGVVATESKDIPYYVMDYVEGAVDSDRFLASTNCKEAAFIAILRGVLSAIAYLHDQGTIHMDIKPGNVLVTPNGVPIVSDLGFAKQLRVDNEFTLIGGTEGYIHPDARKFVEEASSHPSRLKGQAPRSVLKCEWDLYSLGKTLLKLTQVFQKHHSGDWSPYARRYIRLLSCRLLDGLNSEDELALGLSRTTLQEIKYRSVDEAKTDLDKLTGSYHLQDRVPELNLFTQETIQASTLSTTPFTGRVKEIASHPAFMRLGRCTQLGLLNLVYPSARHTRLEHSLGTFSVLCRFLLSLYNDTLNPLFRQIMDEEDLQAALLAALLHDIGQYPLAHDLEEADPQFFDHEDLGMDILEQNIDLRRLIEGPCGWKVPIARVISILRADPDPASLKGSLKDRILHSLIDGPIDADKIDYLMRDSRNLGLTYGSVLDFEHLLRCLTIIYREHDDQTYAVLGIHEKGKVTAEAIGFARYALFGQVYWHHAYRAVKAMIHRIVWETANSPGADKIKMRAEFREFLVPDAAVLPRHEQMTFSIATKDQRQISAHQSQADDNDLAVLEWFSQRSSPAGRELFSLIATRRLFKRIFVLSKEVGPDEKLWSTVADFFRANAKNWKAKLVLQNTFQRRVAELIEQPPLDGALSQPLEPSIRNRFLAEARQKILLLIDIPPERRASKIPLEYLVEEDRQRFKRDEIRVENLEQSTIWRAVQNSFQQSLGKLRLFCHPDFADCLARSIPRRMFESVLSKSVKEVEKTLSRS